MSILEQATIAPSRNSQSSLTRLPILILGVAIGFGSTSPLRAGPCATEIDCVRAQVDARIDLDAGNGRTGRESSAAMRHRQPTPSSIPQAERDLGESGVAEVATAELARARSADQAGDRGA